jgi:glycosyltransferase involved in cell wall biosynthesis
MSAHPKNPRRLNRIILWLQRQRLPIPTRVRQLARVILDRALRGRGPVSPVDNWSKPLIDRAGRLAHAPTVEPRPASSPGGAVRPSPLPRLHCIVATTVLDVGGIDEFAAFLARRLPALGLDVTVVKTPVSRAADTDGGRLTKELRNEGITVVDTTPEAVQGWLRSSGGDVISAHAPPDWFLEAAGMVGVPVVETLHGLPTPIGTDWSRERLRSERIAAFVAVSDLVRRQYMRGNPWFPAEAIITIPNGVNEAHRPRVDRESARSWLGLEEEFLFLSLARVSVQKNTYGLVTAFNEMARTLSAVHLVSAGRVDDAVYAQQVRQLHDELGTRAQIHLRDNFSRPSVLLYAADAFVLDSFFEGWSMASTEALLTGLPLLTSEVGGAREQVGPAHERGIVVGNPLGDAEGADWVRAGRARFRDQVNRDELAAAMSQLVESREAWAATRDDRARAAAVLFRGDDCARCHGEVLRAVARKAPLGAESALDSASRATP